MTAYAFKAELARHDCVKFVWNAQPLEFSSRNGCLSGVRFIRTELEGEGREARCVPVKGSEFEIECNMAVKALGQVPHLDLLGAIGGIEVENGRIRVEPGNGKTSLSGCYAGGDCISKGAEIVNAVQEGKLAGRAIHRYLCN